MLSLPTHRQSRVVRWIPLLILIAGTVIRIGHAHFTDVRNVHDDHFHVIRIILEQHRWPQPDEGWQTYQPPLYHLLGAAVYKVANHQPEPTMSLDNPSHLRARKAIQYISVVAGCGTLAMVLLTLRLILPRRIDAQAIGLVFAAFLPRHIYMSAMSTNDSLTYFWISLGLYSLLRAVNNKSENQSKRETSWWIVVGMSTALALWTKQYGLVLLALLLVLVPFLWLNKSVAARRTHLRGTIIAIVIALLLGSWPYIRSYQLTGNPVAGNYTLRPHTMNDQLPGSIAKTSFFSLRFTRLIKHPWRHLDTVDSWWTQLYARLWFDYDTSITLFQYRPWVEYLLPIWQDRTIDATERERRQMIWPTDITPPSLLLQGRSLYIVGILPILLIPIGLVFIWCKRGTTLQPYILTCMLVLSVAIPLFQTVRQPFRSSMKAAFLLPALGVMAILVAAAFQGLTDRRFGKPIGWILATWFVVVPLIVCWHFVDVSLYFPGIPEYFTALRPDF